MKLTPDLVIGTTINRVVCTEPPARFYSYRACLILEVADLTLLAIGTGTICYGELANDAKLYPAVAWHHTEFINSNELDGLVAHKRIKRLIRTRSMVYDQSMIVLSDGIVIGHCESAQRRMLFLRSQFDEKLESETSYWDYFSDQPVDHLGNDVDGQRVVPRRVGWI